MLIELISSLLPYLRDLSIVVIALTLVAFTFGKNYLDIKDLRTNKADKEEVSKVCKKVDAVHEDIKALIRDTATVKNDVKWLKGEEVDS